MADTVDTDLVVVGAGPGGYAAAFLAADKGMKVTLIDAVERPGGTCLHVGCIPSKALLHTAKVITDARDAAHLGVKFAAPEIDVAAVRNFRFKVVDTLTGNLARLAKARDVNWVHGRGAFTDAHTVAVEGKGSFRFKHAIVATGSVPAMPKMFDLKSPRVMDSTGALAVEDVPKKLLVIGGGYIGLEMGTVYAALGSKVTVVELMPTLLPGCDPDLVTPLYRRLDKLFAKIHLKTKVAKLEDTGTAVRASLEGEEVEEKEPVFDRVLVAVGRRPASAGLGLDKAGVAVDDKGFVTVDEQRRTSVPHVFAIGDVAGEPMLAHKATYEGKVAVEVMHGENVAYDVRAVPAVVFTDPEVAWCGLTETEAKRDKREVKVLRYPWAGSGRALTLDRTEGLTKLICDPASERILGVGIVGVGAGEMIGEAVLMIEMAASARDVALTMHAHPTLSETIMESAEKFYGLTTHEFPRARKT